MSNSEPPVWWKDVLHTAWRELSRANKGNRRLARKNKALKNAQATAERERDTARDQLVIVDSNLGRAYVENEILKDQIAGLRTELAEVRLKSNVK